MLPSATVTWAVPVAAIGSLSENAVPPSTDRSSQPAVRIASRKSEGATSTFARIASAVR
jgi:hypothetical protein